MKKLGSSLNVSVSRLPVDRKSLTSEGSRWLLEYLVEYGYVDKRTVATTALLDMLLMSQCSAFVGSFSSQLGRVTYELMAAEHGGHVPYVSVDYPWCFHFMEKLDVPGFGSRIC